MDEGWASGYARIPVLVGRPEDLRYWLRLWNIVGIWCAAVQHLLIENIELQVQVNSSGHSEKANSQDEVH